MPRPRPISLILLLLTAVYVVAWSVFAADWMWFDQFGRPLIDTQASPAGLVALAKKLPWLLEINSYWIVFSLSLPIGAAWLTWSLWPVRRSNLTIAAVASVVFVLWWQGSVFATHTLVFDTFRAYLARAGLGGLFLIGLAWVTFAVERASQFYERRRKTAVGPQEISLWQPRSAQRLEGEAEQPNIWNPLDPDAWYYGRAKKLNQSLTALISYSVVFLALFMLSTLVGGCTEIYELPAGGGEEQTVAQVVKVQKVIRKKFVVNPFSAILYNVPPIDQVRTVTEEMTKHAYQVGQGEGSGAGFAGGTRRGKVRFIRLEYSGGDWDQDFGVGADLNMLLEYGIRTKHKVADKTESRTIYQLKNFPVGKAPPLVYLTGQKNISVTKQEIEILREYLLEKHGMLFGDNGGSGHFHNQFLALMQQVLPRVKPVKVPLDDRLHQGVPFLPYVAPHGGRDALGWKVDGRWVCYYHPGDIGDAWADGHAGVEPRVWEACYQLGTNIIFYAHAEHSKWLQAQEKE